MEIIHVPEEHLKRWAEEEGPRSAAAMMPREKRAKDRQVYAWQLGQYYFVGPTPDAEMEARIREFVRTTTWGNPVVDSAMLVLACNHFCLQPELCWRPSI